MSLSTLERIEQAKFIPVIVVNTIDQALKLGEVLNQHLPIAEITLRSDSALEALREMKRAFPNLCVGAGTVLNTEQLNAAQQAGADFIVSPGCNPRTIREAQRQALPIIPGINNPTAIEMALEEGLTTLKFFPAEASGGVKMIKALLAPYQSIRLMPTGGIHADNVMDYLQIERVVACGLSWMVEPALMQAQDWQTIEKRILNLKHKLL